MANTKQVNILMPKIWFEQIERQARLKSVEEDRTISYLDLIKEAIKEKFNLKNSQGDSNAR